MYWPLRYSKSPWLWYFNVTRTVLVKWSLVVEVSLQFLFPSYLVGICATSRPSQSVEWPTKTNPGTASVSYALAAESSCQVSASPPGRTSPIASNASATCMQRSVWVAPSPSPVSHCSCFSFTLTLSPSLPAHINAFICICVGTVRQTG